VVATDMQTHAGSALDNPVTLNFDLFVSGLLHADSLLWTSSDLHVDSSRCFPFRARKDIQTDTHARSYRHTTDHIQCLGYRWYG